ncbi:MAG: zinc ABC transporter substrate-binding protein, partial [Spirochaetales bacterium]|nr:zinc ABC transporter substrate-binding protein [Spirochaetales bacterium]
MIRIRHIPVTQFFVSILFIAALLLPLSGCTPKETDTPELLSVFVSIEPQRNFVEKIGGQYISTEVMVKPGQNPATYEPTPGQITKLGKSRIFFTIGVPFENAFIKKIESSLPDLKIIDTAEGISKRKIEDHNHENSTSEQRKELPDPHVWMSPVLVKNQALVIVNALTLLAPEKSDYFKQNYNIFIRELDQLNMDIEKILEPLKGKTMFVYHPSFGYFTDLYGLKQEAV